MPARPWEVHALPPPPFAVGRPWRRGKSKTRAIDRRVWYDPSTGFEYERDPNPAKHSWHEIDARAGLYREIDPLSGQPVKNGLGEGAWRSLR
jgi:hypothetical protein